jgi:hypothetical protein
MLHVHVYKHAPLANIKKTFSISILFLEEVNTLLQKPFLVSVGNIYQVSASPTDTICRIQKMIHLLCRLLPTDTTNGFSKIKKNLSPDLGPSDPDPGLGVVAITVEPGWKTIHDVLFAVVAHPRVGSQGQVVMKVPQGDAGAARRGLARPGSPYLPAARCRAEGTMRKRTRSALRVVPCRGEAL